MPRAALSQAELDQGREAICKAASRLFATKGYAGVTLRAIASEMGCSPMTPYRYYADKAAIFDAVRRVAFARFAEALGKGAAESPDPLVRLDRLARAYVAFALDERDAYCIMFELDQVPEPAAFHPRAEEAAAWLVLQRSVEEAVDAGLLAGDPISLAHLFWGGLHGLVSLHLAGKLQLGRRLEDLTGPMLRVLLVGTRPDAADPLLGASLLTDSISNEAPDEDPESS